MSKLLETKGYESWLLPPVSDTSQALHGASAVRLQELQREAYEEGFSQGKEQGYAKGYREGYDKGEQQGYAEKQQQMEQNHTAITSILELLADPLKELDDEIINQLADLSMIVASQVIRRELHAEKGEIIGVVREAMSALPATTRKVILNIHPEDAIMIREAFSLGQKEDSDELRWKLVEDPLITRGGCKIASENSRIDATVEARLNRVISTLLGDERQTDD